MRDAVKKRLVAYLGLPALALAVGAWWLAMPGADFREPAGEATPEEAALARQLEADVRMLADTIGERNVLRPTGLQQAANWVAGRFEEAGFKPERQGYTYRKVRCENLVATVPGGDRRDEIIVVGAHYDSTVHCPAANDNASGVAALLAMAERLNRTRPARTVRFVAFTNEELAFQTPDMGSWVYAKQCRARHEHVVGMIALDTVGMYTERPESQSYPAAWLQWLFPGTGNFVSFVSNPASRPWLTDVVGGFREGARLPSQGAAVPDAIPGAAWSDHWAFWQEGYPALLVSDTAPFRDKTYHTAQDTPEHLNYVGLARLSLGLGGAIAKLAE